MGGKGRIADKNRSLLVELDQQLTRLRRRATGQKRSIDAGAAAWQRWSSTMDETERLIDQIATSPAPDIGSLVAKFRAILWLIETNESLLDLGDLRRLRRFRRDVGTLARNGSDRA